MTSTRGVYKREASFEQPRRQRQLEEHRARGENNGVIVARKVLPQMTRDLEKQKNDITAVHTRKFLSRKLKTLELLQHNILLVSNVL
jgi:hypothetical protein